MARRGTNAILVNRGILGTGIALPAIGAYHHTTAWPLALRDFDALVAAAASVAFQSVTPRLARSRCE